MFPPLEGKPIHRDVSKYSEGIKDSVIYEYLFNINSSHRWIDKNIIGAHANMRGYEAMRILHSFGLSNAHKGYFRDYDILSALELLNSSGDDKVKKISNSLQRYTQGALITLTVDIDEKEYPEGRVAYRQHKIRERNPQVIKKAKKLFAEKNQGKLFCEVCGFNFADVYGSRGNDFIEGHHKRLISEMTEGEKTKIEDIAMLCSNCHRMIHKSPTITIEELAEIIAENKCFKQK